MKQTDWSLPDLLQMSGSYWSACTLHAGVKLDLFTALHDAPATAGDAGIERHQIVVGEGYRAHASLLGPPGRGEDVVVETGYLEGELHGWRVVGSEY